jgi:hypothetical protein
MTTQTTETSVIALPDLAEGEIYLSGFIDAEGRITHTILLPGDIDDGTWHNAKEWAASIGGELPTRVELAVAYEKLRDQFQRDWYWSNQTDEDDSASAWCQNFFGGAQNYGHKGYDVCRARAVRRLIIE